jgi:hypothetical protein
MGDRDDDDEEVANPQKSSYTEYQPREFNRPHPDPLAESSSLAAIRSPRPAARFIDVATKFQDVLSGPQMEVVALALAKHEEFCDGYRRGFFLGDGTGAGKGRCCAALLMAKQSTSKKSIWISAAADLEKDAKRDFSDIRRAGNIPNLILLRDLKANGGNAFEGVVFCTYSTLAKENRLREILEWMEGQREEEVDGYIILVSMLG